MTNEAYSTQVENLSDLEAYVGKEMGLSGWYEITQEMINTFAKTTQDEQWIHVDVERSKKYSPYKTPIAHGFLVLSMASRVSYDTFQVKNVAMGVNYGLNKVRFINATKAGAFIRGRMTLADYKAIEGGARYTMNIVFEIKGEEKPACVAEFIGQAYAMPA